MRMKYYKISADKGVSWTEQWHTSSDLDCYLTDEIGADIGVVAYIHNDTGMIWCAYVDDRTEVDSQGYPIYLGRFGNCIIALNAKRTDRLYLLTLEAARKIRCNTDDTIQTKGNLLMENSKLIIERID